MFYTNYLGLLERQRHACPPEFQLQQWKEWLTKGCVCSFHVDLLLYVCDWGIVADAMGLPASRFAPGGTVGFEAYAVKPKPGQLTTVYQSEIASVTQAGYTANGGATQYVIPELGKFSAPQAIPGGSFAPVPYSPTAQPPLTPLLIPAATGIAKK